MTQTKAKRQQFADMLMHKRYQDNRRFSGGWMFDIDYERRVDAVANENGVSRTELENFFQTGRRHA